MTCHPARVPTPLPRPGSDDEPRRAVAVDRVIRRFYDSFRRQHVAFAQSIRGIPETDARAWYASLTLHRLMFVYFLQKKGLLDGDTDYLPHHLRRSQLRSQCFYRGFLLRLFREGLGQPARTTELEALLGQVPYLNGRLFNEHELERSHSDLHIADEAFTGVFRFFDSYRWHLDRRPLCDDRDINPDVLGYLFEKYVNQKQMGAYYTREDITEYIARSTILPSLFDAVAKRCPAAFHPHGPVWRRFRADPDRYLHAAVRHGVDLPLPEGIAGSGRPAAAGFALPTETWREHVFRRDRCRELRLKLQAGEVCTANDLVTYNLDLRRFAQDVIEGCEDPELLAAFYEALAGRPPRRPGETHQPGLRVLDPTCGSGAFLFAALNVLAPLYDACLRRMQTVLDDSSVPCPPAKGASLSPPLTKGGLGGVSSAGDSPIPPLTPPSKGGEGTDSPWCAAFLQNLDPMKDYPSRTYFILESIVVNNLYGVDLMEEAVEICKLRLLLELVAHAATAGPLRPLPDMESNIRAGNALVGRVTPEGIPCSLSEVGQPGAFHWAAEFPDVMRHGGFDVCLGNPPYLRRSEVEKAYTLDGYRTAACPDVYALVLERAVSLLAPAGRVGMIVPLSLAFSRDFDSCRRLLLGAYAVNWFSSFGRIPSALFSFDVRVRNTIHLGVKGPAESRRAYTTRLHRWFGVARPSLFPSLAYAPFRPEPYAFRIPKVNTGRLAEAFARCLEQAVRPLEASLTAQPTPHVLYFKKTAYNWLTFCRDLPPCYDRQGQGVPQTKFGAVYFAEAVHRDLAFLFLNGKILFAFWCLLGDDFDVTRGMFADFPLDLGAFPPRLVERLLALVPRLERQMVARASFKWNAGKRVGTFNVGKCRAVTDQSDAVLAEALDLQDAWPDIELLYSQTVRSDVNVQEGGS